MKKTFGISTFLLLSLIATGSRTLVAAGSSASWLERAANAPLQIVAVCQSRASHWEGGSIYSDAEVSVQQVVRGAPGLTLVVRQRGGEVDGIGQKVSHATLLEPGKSYLLFLNPGEGGSWSPTAKGVNPIDAVANVATIGGEPLEQVLASLGGGA